MDRRCGLFRADGASFIGLGHVMRSLALAEELRARGWLVQFATKPYEEETPERVRAAGFGLGAVPPEADSEADLGATLRIAEDMGARVVITDGYGFGTAFLEGLRDAGLTVASIDDVAAFYFPSDLLVNQNIGAQELPYRTAAYTRRLLGPAYAMLRPRFRALRDVALNRPAGNPPDVLVTFGASDVSRQTQRAIVAVGLLRQPVRLTVLIGGGCRHRGEIEAAAAQSPCPTEVVVDPPDVASVLAAADVALSAAGTMTWELCCLGRPMLLMAVADNQRGIATGMGRAGAAVDLGWSKDAAPEAIAAGVDRLLTDSQARQDMAGRAAKLVDGLGTQRVARALEEAYAGRV